MLNALKGENGNGNDSEPPYKVLVSIAQAADLAMKDPSTDPPTLGKHTRKQAAGLFDAFVDDPDPLDDPGLNWD